MRSIHDNTHTNTGCPAKGRSRPGAGSFRCRLRSWPSNEPASGRRAVLAGLVQLAPVLLIIRPVLIKTRRFLWVVTVKEVDEAERIPIVVMPHTD